MTEIEKFRNEVERFISAKGLTPTSFGKKYAGDPLFVFQIREGREPRTGTRQKVIEAMRGQQERAAS